MSLLCQDTSFHPRSSARIKIIFGFSPSLWILCFPTYKLKYNGRRTKTKGVFISAMSLARLPTRLMMSRLILRRSELTRRNLQKVQEYPATRQHNKQQKQMTQLFWLLMFDSENKLGPDIFAAYNTNKNVQNQVHFIGVTAN